MPDDDLTDDIDWGAVRSSQVALAEMIYTYWMALTNCGFGPQEAMGLTLAYQANILAK